MEKRVEEQTAITDDAKIWYREKDILQQEVGSRGNSTSVSASALSGITSCYIIATFSFVLLLQQRTFPLYLLYMCIKYLTRYLLSWALS